MAESGRRGRDVRRVFKPTESLLTRHSQERNPYTEGLLNLGFIHLVLVPFALAVREVYSPGSNNRHFSGLRHLIGGPSELLMTALIFTIEFLVSFAVYFLFLGWAFCYKYAGRAAHGLFLLPLVPSVIVYRYWLLSYLLEINFPPGARFACCLQQLILICKWVSFVSENGRKVLYPWHKDDETGPAVWYAGQMEPQIGSFSSYVYFLFCPVLLYRDRYPRKQRNLRRATNYFIMFLVLVWVCYVILFEFGMPQTMHRDEIRRVAVHNLFLGFVLLACSHTFLLQCWSNCWADLLGFADCTFYEEWWSTESLPDFLRKWNPLIQEWLKAYIYRPLRSTGLPAGAAMLVILVLSAFEHDFLLSAGLGYFMPVYIVEYGICGMLLNLKPKMSRWMDQMIMCFGLSVGLGLQITLYCTEVAAVIHCPAASYNATWFQGFRMIDCYKEFNT
jgi:hypothetical protein